MNFGARAHRDLYATLSLALVARDDTAGGGAFRVVDGVRPFALALRTATDVCAGGADGGRREGEGGARVWCIGRARRCKDGDWEIVQGVEVGEFSRAKMDATAQELTEERDAVAHLLG